MNDPDVTCQLIERIQNQCTEFELCGHAWFSDALDDLEGQMPACLIYQSGDQSLTAESELFITTQRVAVSYGVWVVAPRSKLKAVRASLRQTLLGWQPTDTHNPMSYVSGKAENISGEIIWWREIWQTQAHIRATQ